LETNEILNTSLYPYFVYKIMLHLIDACLIEFKYVKRIER